MWRTIKLILEPTETQTTTFKETCFLFTEVFNAICSWGWENKEKNGIRLHHEFYHPLKIKYPSLVSDLHVQARVKATEAIKGALTLKKKNKKVSCPKSVLCPPRYNLHTFKVDWESRTVRMSTTAGRQTIRFKIPSYAEKYTRHEVDTADLLFRDGVWVLNVCLTIPAPEIKPIDIVIGIDLGLAQPAVLSNNKFLGKKSWKNIENKRFKLKRKLQAKGTKSAKRHLKKIRKSQSRFRRDCDHVLSKQVVQAVPAGSTIVVENLTNIRNSIKAKKKTENKRRLHGWSFAQLRSFIEYKAEERGCMVTGVDPRHTSQQCSCCGYTAKNNRRSRGLFKCQKCGFTLHADLNAARNIAAKYRAQVSISDMGGRTVNAPIVGEDVFHSATHKLPVLAGSG